MTSKRYVFTLNNYSEQDIANLEEAAQDVLNVRYIIYGRETAPVTGTPHLQGFAVFVKKIRMTQAKRFLKLERAHLEQARGTSAEAAEYCKKEGAFSEFGTCPQDAGEAGAAAERSRWENARKAAKEGKFEEVPADIFIRYYGNLRKIYTDAQKIPESIEDMDFHWFYGESGTGKSRTARTENPDYYLKGLNKWWDGFDNQPCVIIEEWTPMDVSYERIMGHYLKQWCDHHPFQAEYKGGMKMIRPTKIIITSNYTLEECFHETNTLEPLKRRIKIHHFTLPFAQIQ